MTKLQEALGTPGHTAVRDGQYNLLLGAGASFGALSSNGKPLPLGDAFGAELVQALGLKVQANTPLPYIWEAAVAKLGNEATLRMKYLEPRFTSCTPAAYHRGIATFAWHRIYTLNVDDVVERTYEQEKSALQKAQLVHFDEDFKDTDPSADEVQIVHLHGSAGLPNLPVVFGPPSYAAATTRQHTWWHVFADAFAYQPMIIIGATLREPDFEAYLSLKQRQQQVLTAPSIFVSPAIDDAVLATCSRLGLIPIELTGEQFFAELAEAVKSRERLSVRRSRTARTTSLLSAITSRPLLATVARQFLVVNSRDQWPQHDRPAEKFYEGFDAVWDDIRSSRDVTLETEAIIQREVVKEVTSVRAGEAGSRPPLLLLEGTAGTGKSTALMRVSESLAKQGISTLYFQASDRLRDDALLEVAGTAKEPFVVVVDNFAENINQIRRFVENYPANGPKCAIIGADRNSKKRFIQRHLEDAAKPSFFPMQRLVPSEALDLARKLRLSAKLGQFSGLTDAELATRFTGTRSTDWAGQLLVILMEVVPGGAFRDRLASEWAGIPQSAERTFYGAACLAAACGVPVRSSHIFKAAQSLDSNSLFESMRSGALRGLLQWEADIVKPRHRVVGEEIVSHCMTPAELFEISQRLCSAISPYVSRNTIMTRAPEYRLARQLMDADGIVIPRLSGSAEAWFGNLERHYGWNSRFWEQRAILAMKQKRFSRARDYAEQAVGLEKHPLPMTTCARVWIDSVERDQSLTNRTREELLLRSATLLDEAIRLADSRGRVEIHPYHILLELCVRASRSFQRAIPESLRGLLQYHARDAATRFASEPEIRQALERLRREGLI